MQVNWLAIIASAAATFLIGGLWYSPVLFYKPWVRLNGYTETTTPKAGGRVFVLSFLAQLIAAANLAFFVAGEPFGLVVAAAAAVGVGWVAMSFGVTYLFEQRPFALWMINAGYHVVSFLVMGLIIGAWR